MNESAIFIAVKIEDEPRKEGHAYGISLRCWNCGSIIGERVGDTLTINSNKVEVGGIPLVEGVYRRCRGGRSNPACRAINTLPKSWTEKKAPL
jgi:hypothetical protein